MYTLEITGDEMRNTADKLFDDNFGNDMEQIQNEHNLEGYGELVATTVRIASKMAFHKGFRNGLEWCRTLLADPSQMSVPIMQVISEGYAEMGKIAKEFEGHVEIEITNILMEEMHKKGFIEGMRFLKVKVEEHNAKYSGASSGLPPI